MFTLNKIYRPITAQPFRNNDAYIEIEPCEALKPYICCFWGTVRPFTSLAMPEVNQGLVIPDTCMDIIFNIDMNKNELQDIFCGINDKSFCTEAQSVPVAISYFAVRFYFWAVPLFCDESMSKVLNAYVETEAYFKNFRRDFESILSDNLLINERIEKAEEYLLKKLNLNKQNNNVMNAVYKLLKSKGTAGISELADYTMISQRRLERLFSQYIGMTAKKLSCLVRYQYLWQDILSNGSINVQDAVFKYKYADQSHLLNDFKKYHTMNPKEARAFAYNIR